MRSTKCPESPNATVVLNNENSVTLIKPGEDSDEEKELTNLNWLMGNQNITWPNALLDEDGEAIHNAKESNRFSVDSGDKSFVGTLNSTFSKNANTSKSCSGEYSDPKKMQQLVSQHNTIQVKRPTPAERYEAFVNKIKRDLKEYEKFATNYKTDVSEKPPFNYSHIIGMAMLENGRVTLQQICHWIESKFAFFRVRKKWNNSIRHNLSLHHCFRKIDRKREEKGKGGYWELGVDPKKCDRKRIRNRKSSQAKQRGLGKVNSSAPTEPQRSTPAADIDVNQSNNSSNKNTMFETDSLSDITGLEDYTETPITSIELNSNKSQLSQADLELVDMSTLPVVLNDTADRSNGAAMYAEIFQMPTGTLQDSNNMDLQQQYELGTIIVSTTAGSMDDPADIASFNCMITDNYNSENVVYTEDEVPHSSEDIVVASYLGNNVLGNEHSGCEANTIFGTQDSNGPSVIVEHIPQILAYTTSAEAAGNLSLNCDYTNFRQYVDGIDEAFQYFHCIESSRNDDILDNLLDVCVSDY